MLYVTLAVLLSCFAFVNIIVPISGSAVVTPALTMLFGVKDAIAIATVYFFVSNMPRIYFFRAHILWQEIWHVLPASVIGALFGTILLIHIPEQLVLCMTFGVLSYFFIQRLRSKHAQSRKALHQYGIFSGLLSGSLQGSGLPGSDIRNGYLYARGLTIAQIHGTSSIVGSVTMLLASVVRGGTGDLTVAMIIPVLAALPFIVFATYIARHVHFKIPKHTQDQIVVGVMGFSLLLLFVAVIRSFADLG